MRQALFCIFLHFFASTLPYFCGTWCLVFEVWSGAEVIAWVSFLVFSHYLANIVYRDIKAISRDLYDIFVLITGWCLTENKLSLHTVVNLKNAVCQIYVHFRKIPYIVYISRDLLYIVYISLEAFKKILFMGVDVQCRVLLESKRTW